MVTGLVVNERVNVPRRIRRQLRAAVHRAARGEPVSWNGTAAGPAMLLGVLAHLGTTLPGEASRLRRQLQAAKA